MSATGDNYTVSDVGGGSGFGSLGAGLVGTGRRDLQQQGQQPQVSPDVQRAIEAVVHPDTLQEWREAGEDYPLSPEDQQGVRFKLQTMHSRYREYSIDHIWRRKEEGKEVLLVHVTEYAENNNHNRRAWPHFEGKRTQTIFENVQQGYRTVRNERVGSRDVYYIPFSKENVEKILAKHNVEGIETKFYLDVGYTTFGNISKNDFMNLPFEQLHDKYLRGPPRLVAQQQQDTKLAEMTATLQQLITQLKTSQNNQDPERTKEITAEARALIDQIKKERGGMQEVSVTKPLITTTNSKVITEVMPMEEHVGFVRTQHDEKGNPIKKTIEDTDGNKIEEDLAAGGKKSRK